MAQPRVSLIVAVGHDRVIGTRGQLPWRLPEDLRRFKRLTTGHPVIMGRKTFDSIGKPLVDRANVVVTRNPAWPAPPGVRTAPEVEAALDLAGALDPHVFVIGGAEVYAAALPRADEVLATLVHLRVPHGDARFPALGRDWHLAEAEPPRAAAPAGPGAAALRFAYVRLERAPGADRCPLCQARSGARDLRTGLDPGLEDVLLALGGEAGS